MFRWHIGHENLGDAVDAYREQGRRDLFAEASPLTRVLVDTDAKSWLVFGHPSHPAPADTALAAANLTGYEA